MLVLTIKTYYAVTLMKFTESTTVSVIGYQKGRAVRKRNEAKGEGGKLTLRVSRRIRLGEITFSAIIAG